MNAGDAARLEAIEARLRTEHVGLAVVDLPPRPVYTNDPELEARREAEYNAYSVACEAEAEVLNAEALRWHAKRLDIACALFREEISADASSSSSSRAALPKRRGLSDMLAAADMLSADLGFAASSFLATLADGEMELNAAVTEARELFRSRAVAERRNEAIHALITEKRMAFEGAWGDGFVAQMLQGVMERAQPVGVDPRSGPLHEQQRELSHEPPPPQQQQQPPLQQSAAERATPTASREQEMRPGVRPPPDIV